MITKSNIRTLLDILGFSQEGTVYTKRYEVAGATLKVDVASEHIFYKESGITVGRETTSNFSELENFVVLECVDRLLSKGYRAEHIELEPQWKLGHSSKSGYADIWIRTFGDGRMIGTDEDKDSLLIIECKKTDEFQGAWNDTLEDGAQLFSYFQQEKSTRFLCLYTSDIIEDKVVSDYYLLNVQDNKKMLENEEGVLSYDKASNNKQLYRVWHETYHCDYARIGLFEESVQPYHIGKDKYTVADLKAVSNETIKKKYSEFSNILRQHNVGAHENAFDKLVNLFLAKVVDETNNPDNLHFYWKGSAYDDDFQLQDRLQRLYRDGMKKFLGENVTYIEDAEIDKAFRRFKNDPDATRKTIKDYFRALKFFSDNDFSFISVHNKKLFQQNAIILRKVILMLQDIRLKDSDTHQFLGDLFEGFLTKGVKQSEGQFFTPMPIVRFIVTSLPLEQLIKDSQDVPYAIDYACGAGHFLTEYADRIKEFVKQYRPDLSLHDYYSRIMGIEKEYRLSKVSKVSAFMYGHDETQIVYSDALKSHPNVEEGKYSVLIANPPYSVSGFLETLSEQDRKKYKLFNSNINLAKNNAIETFFIERAAQLMKAGGVAGIILPVSVLNKGGIYAKAREIILENFHIVSLVELGSGTFGKTGTNTVVMFLRRKETNTPDADHYASRVECWFNLSENGNEVYQDTELMEKYCEHLGYAVEDYQEFLKGNMTETFINSEVVQAYHNSFFGSSRNAMKDVYEEAKNIRTRYVAKTKTATFRALSAEEKEEEADKAFYAFVKAIEREKMYFFMLAVQTETPVLLVKSPSTNAEIKKFLGYEWINRKGSEGIKYLNVVTESDDEDGNEAEDDTMQQISGICAINTCLFNPSKYNDQDKINYLIRKNFLGESFGISDEISDFTTTAKIVDMIEFTRTSFSKEFKTSVSLKVVVKSKYESIPLKKFCTKINPSKDEISGLPKDKVVSFIEMSSLGLGRINNMVNKTIGELSDGGYTYFKENDVLVAKITPCMENGKCAVARNLTNGLGLGSTEFHVLRTEDEIKAKYLLEWINRNEIRKVAASNMTGASGHRRVPEYFYQQLPIPNAPYDAIKKIVAECSKIETVYQQCIDDISRLKDEMNAILEESHSKATTVLRLDNEQVFNLSIGRRVLKSELKKDGAYEVFSANVFEPFGRIGSSLLTDFSKPSVLWGIDGDWMVNYLHADRPFHPTDHCGVINVLDENVILPKYLVYPLLKAGEHERFSRANRASTERIKALTIRIPSIDIQKNTVTKVIEIENEINTLKQKMKECKYQKQVILDKYLK